MIISVSWFNCCCFICSGRTFRDSALGVAYVPGICEGSMYGGLIVGRGLRSVDRVSITAAHEIGHTLGMEHDNEIHGNYH